MSKITIEDRTNIIKMYKDGISIAKIAEKMERNWKTVANALYKAGIEPEKDWKAGKRKRETTLFTLEEDKMIENLYVNKKKSLSQIADKYNCGMDAVRNALIRRKVTMNPKGNRYREFSQSEMDEIKSLYVEHEFSQDKIAMLIETSQSMVSKLLIQMGVSKRGNVLRNGGVYYRGGYKYILLSNDDEFYSMAHRAGYVSEHRYVMAKYIGRPLTKNETVHHIDGDKLNNHIDNLQLRRGRHGKNECFKCADCGSINIVSKEI